MELGILSQVFMVAAVVFIVTCLGCWRLGKAQIEWAVKGWRRQVEGLRDGMRVQVDAYHKRGEELRAALVECSEARQTLEVAENEITALEHKVMRLERQIEATPSAKERARDLVAGVLEGLLECRELLDGAFSGMLPDTDILDDSTGKEWPEDAQFEEGDRVTVFGLDPESVPGKMFAAGAVGTVVDVRLAQVQDIGGVYEYAVRVDAGQCEKVLQELGLPGVVAPLVSGVGAWVSTFNLERYQAEPVASPA